MLFIDLNVESWNDERPDTDPAVDALLAVAARDVGQTWFANRLRERVAFRT